MPSPPTTNLAVWLAADAGVYHDAGTTLATSGQTVQQWNDQSGNGNNFIQSSSGSRPTYNTNVYSGLPTISFSASQLFTSSYGPALGDFTVFVVYRQTGAITHAYERLIDKSYNHGFWVGRSGSTASQMGGGIVQAGGALGDYIYLPDGLLYDLAIQRSGSIKNMYAILGAYSVTNLTVPGTATDTTTVSIGGDSVGDDFRGDICEVLIYNAALTGATLSSVWSYLARWPVATVLPSLIYMGTSMIGGAAAGDVLQFYRSPDGIYAAQEEPVYTPTAPNVVRDPALLNSGSVLWIAHTATALSGTSINYFAVAKSFDNGATWTAVANVDCSAAAGTGSGARCWGPIWFVSPVDGTVHIFVSISTTGDPGNMQAYEVHPTNSAYTTWSTPVAVTGTGFPTALLVGPMFYVGGVYYLWYKVETSSPSTEFIQVASSSSLLSGYTNLLTGNWAGWGSGNEAMCPIVKADGTWRVYFCPDGDQNQKYSDSGVTSPTSWGSATWTTPALVRSSDGANMAQGSWLAAPRTSMIGRYAMDGVSGPLNSDPLTR